MSSQFIIVNDTHLQLLNSTGNKDSLGGRQRKKNLYASSCGPVCRAAQNCTKTLFFTIHNVMLCDAMALCVMLQEQYIKKIKCSVSLSQSK